MNEVVIAVITTLNVDRCQVLEVLPDGEKFAASRRSGMAAGRRRNLVVKASKDTQAGYTVRYQRTTVVEDFKTETRFRPTFAERDCHAASSVVVLVHNSHPFGVLGVHSATVRGLPWKKSVFWSPWQIFFLKWLNANSSKRRCVCLKTSIVPCLKNAWM